MNGVFTDGNDTANGWGVQLKEAMGAIKEGLNYQEWMRSRVPRRGWP